jgi:hypothetical protein
MIKRWLLLKTSDPAYAEVISMCEDEHKTMFPKNELSIRLNNDETLALVKVCTEDDNFFDAIPESVLVSSYTEETHGYAVALLSTPAWTVEDENNG